MVDGRYGRMSWSAKNVLSSIRDPPKPRLTARKSENHFSSFQRHAVALPAISKTSCGSVLDDISARYSGTVGRRSTSRGSSSSQRSGERCQRGSSCRPWTVAGGTQRPVIRVVNITAVTRSCN